MLGQDYFKEWLGLGYIALRHDCGEARGGARDGAVYVGSEQIVTTSHILTLQPLPSFFLFSK